MAKRSKGIAFLLLGFVFLLAAGGWWLYNELEDQSAGQQAAEILQEFDQIQQTQSETAPVITVGGDAFCGKVIVPKLEIELPVYDEWNDARLKSAPCRYTGRIETDDMIIAAHNYRRHFGRLNQLKPGDSVTFIDAYGAVHDYEICEIVTLDGTAISDMHAGGWDLTLFTCTKDGQQRVAARCERKS